MVFTKKLTTAVDISDGFVKIAVISVDKSGKGLHLLDSVKLPTDKDKEIAKEVRSLISKNKLGNSLILASFPRHLVTIRNVRLPTANKEEVKNMAGLQAVKYLPYSQEEIVVSYKILDVTKEGYTDILLIMAQRKLVNRFVDIFKYAGIPVEKLALSSEGILNWYSRLEIDDTSPVAVIDLDKRHTHIQIVKNKTLLFSRSVSFNMAVQPSDKDTLLREIRLSFDSYLKERDENIARMILTGNENYSKDLSLLLSDSFSIPCEYIGQLRNIPLKEGADKSLHLSRETSYSHLLGIAHDPDKLAVNLLPPDIIKRKSEQALKNELTKTAVLFLSVIVVIFGLMEKRVSEKRARLREIDSRLKAIEPEVKKLSRLKENIELIQNQLTFKNSSIAVIREIYEILPKDVSLSLFEFEDKNRILLRGTTKELSSVFNLLPLLEKSPYFKNVKINYATKRTFKNTEFADFEIICALH